jgi:exonuclease SbcD
MSLKVLHTSDWHLGKTFRETNFDLLDIQRRILEDIRAIVRREAPQIVLVAGDVFDSYNPPFEAEKLFYETITSIAENGRVVVVVAGNHDSPEKLETALPLIAGKHSIAIFSTFDYSIAFAYENATVRVTTEDHFLKVHLKDLRQTVAIHALPYPSEVRMGLSGEDFLNELKRLASHEPKFTCDRFLFLSHLFVQGGKKSGSERVLLLGGIESVQSELLPQKADYVALGHLHRYQAVGHGTYSGSIYPFDIMEIEDKKGVCLWHDGITGFIEFSNIPKIRKLVFETMDDAIANVPQDEDYCYVVINTPPRGTIDSLNKVYKGKLVGIRFGAMAGEPQDEVSVDVSSLSDADLFREYCKSRHGKEPDAELVALFLRCLEEARSASH